MNTCKIKSIKKIVCNNLPVYDISVPKYKNFVLANNLVVHNCEPYQYFKTTIYEHRLELYPNKLLTQEVINLERNINTGKVDHPVGGCFTGNTKVQLVDGRSLTFLDLVEEYQSGKTNYVYSMNLNTKKIEPQKIIKAWKTLENQLLMKITLDNDECIECTLGHKFMLRNGEYIEAKDLLPGDSLMPLYVKKNHKVKAVEFIDKKADVYDIEVTQNHNFALASGVFVHNSKDQSDAVCGATFTASHYAEEFAYTYGETAETILRINMGDNGFVDNPEEQLKQLESKNPEYANKYIEQLHNSDESILDIKDENDLVII